MGYIYRERIGHLYFSWFETRMVLGFAIFLGGASGNFMFKSCSKLCTFKEEVCEVGFLNLGFASNQAKASKYFFLSAVIDSHLTMVLLAALRMH